MSTKKITSKPRITVGEQNTTLPELDLLDVQKESYQWLVDQGIRDLFESISPIEDYSGKNWTLSFGDYFFEEPKMTVSDALEKDLSYESPMRVNITLTNKKTGKSHTQKVFAGDIPQMTPRGTFIINGVERCVVSQIVRAPGVYFTGEIDRSSGRMLHQAEVRPMHGSWFDFTISRTDVLSVRIDRRRKIPVTILLRIMGYPHDEDILKLFPNDKRFITKTIEKDPTKTYEEALLEIYKKVRPGEPLIIENAKERIGNLFFNPRVYNLGEVGRYKMNKRLDVNVEDNDEGRLLTSEDVVKIVDYLIGLANGQGRIDNIDHLGNRRVRRVGELVATTAFRTGMLRLERTIKERMSLTGAVADLTPSQLINPKPLIAAINEFFRVSQLSTIIDQTNPLSELDNLRRLTVMGTGGVTRERASFSIRDVHSSQYGRICPVRTPEGPNIGLVTYMTLMTRINDHGFLETPYRKVNNRKITDEVVYMQADDEETKYLTHSNVGVKDNVITDEIVAARHSGEFMEVDSSKIEFIDVTSQQVVGTSASLIPFIAHDEANRALMGTHMQCQAVPLIKPSAPVVGTGMEKEVPRALGRTVAAEADGIVEYVDAKEIRVKENDGTIKKYSLEKFKRTSQSTSFSQKPMVFMGDKVKKGQVIVDGPACEDGELALGQNVRLAFMAYDGLGYEDAIVISDRLLHEDLLTSINIEEYETDVIDTKLGPEETTRDIPNVGEVALRNLDKDGVVTIGSEVDPNDILVGKIAPKGETELTAEERLLRAIFGEKAREVRDTSLRMPHGERGIVVGVKTLDREKGDELDPGTMRRIMVKVAQLRKITVGDKLAGRHGNKGVISKVVPQADMPYLPDGTTVDMIISPLSVYNRMNLGQLLETTLGWAGDNLGTNIAVPVFNKIPEKVLFETYKKAGIPISGKTVLYDGRTGKPFEREVVYGIGYVMKLIHMIEDKTHARSTGPYSLVTQQPLGGKAQMGGQRVGEMEVWTLEAHKAAYTLQEMLTTKSDDVVGRARAFEAIVKGLEIPTPTIPESFKVLLKELESLSLHVKPMNDAATAALVADDADEEDTGDESDVEVAVEEKIKVSDDTVTEEVEVVVKDAEEEIVVKEEISKPKDEEKEEEIKTEEVIEEVSEETKKGESK